MASNSSSASVGVTGLLGVAFIVLKLCSVIDWSWWWVLCPFWAPIALLVVLGLGYVIFTATEKKEKG